MKYHINVNTGKPVSCSATQKACPREHYASKEAAQMAIAAEGLTQTLSSSRKNTTPIKNANEYGKVSVFKVGDRTVSFDKAKELMSVRQSVGRVLTYRAELGDLSEDKKRTSAAYKRFQTLADYSFARGNDEMMQKLQFAQLAPSSFLINKDGERIHVDDVLEPANDHKKWEDSRKKAEYALTKLAQNKDIEPKKYSYDGLTVTVKDNQLNEDYAKSLPPEVITSISTQKSSIDINRAKEVLTDDEREQLITFSHVAEVIDHRGLKDSNVGDFQVSKEGSAQEQFDKTAANYGNLVKETQSKIGGKSALRAKRDEITTYAKAEAEKLNDKYIEEYQSKPKYGRSIEEKTRSGAKNIVFPGRKFDTGIMVSARETVNRTKAYEMLSPEKIDAISVTNMTIDLEKAKSVLSTEQYEQLTSARTVSLREATAPRKAK